MSRAPVRQRWADAGLGWLMEPGDAVPAPLEVMTLGNSARCMAPTMHPAALQRVIGLGELAEMDVICGPYRLGMATYDTWLAVMRAVNPQLRFTDPSFPSFRRSLPITLAFAATASRPTAVLTGLQHRVVDRPGPREPDREAGPTGRVRVRVDGSVLTGAAGQAWNGDLPRLLQQVLFDTADSITF